MAGAERVGGGAAGGVGGSWAGWAAAWSRCGPLAAGGAGLEPRTVRALRCPAPTAHAYWVWGVPYSLCRDE